MHLLTGVAIALAVLLLRVGVLTGVLLAVLLLSALRLAVLRLSALRLAVMRLPLLLLAVLRGGRLSAAVHLPVLHRLPELLLPRRLPELALVRRRTLPRASVVRPRVAVPVPLLGLVLGVVVPTGWIAHRQSIT
nr:hypothetical protein [Kribbella turkmenica]